MQGYLTYNRIINLWATFFYHKEWYDQSLDYIAEKYGRVFSSLPDRDYRHTLPEKKIMDFDQKLHNFTKKWKYKKLSDDDVRMLFTIDHITDGYTNLRHIVCRYNDLFTSYDYINDKSQLFGLHELLVQTIESYEERYVEEMKPYKRMSTLLKIRKRLK